MKCQRYKIFVVCGMALAMAACKREVAQPPPAAVPTAPSAMIDEEDLAGFGSLIILSEPRSGQRVSSGFEVKGISRTFESTVNWSLKVRDGTVLASGYLSGGGVDGPGAFSGQIAYKTSERQLGQLEVFEQDASDGEGLPPPRNVIWLVLEPSG